MEAIETQAVLGQPAEGRSLDRSTEGSRRPKSDIIDQHDHDVGRTHGSFDVERFGFGRVTRVHFRDGRLIWRGNRKDGSVDFIGGNRKAANEADYDKDRQSTDTEQACVVRHFHLFLAVLN
jgi:hypothetical protein